jgi:hypothetical protein
VGLYQQVTGSWGRQCTPTQKSTAAFLWSPLKPSAPLCSSSPSAVAGRSLGARRSPASGFAALTNREGCPLHNAAGWPRVAANLMPAEFLLPVLPLALAGQLASCCHASCLPGHCMGHWDR